MKIALLLSTFFFALNPCFAGWGGMREGNAQTKVATYQNCDIFADFFVNTAKGTFEVAKLDYSCAQEDGSTVFQAYTDVRMAIEGNQLLLNGQVVGSFSEQHVDFVFTAGKGASYSFDFVPGTAALETRILDTQTGMLIEGRLW